MSEESLPAITLYFLAASRAIRIAWLLEELSLPYNLVTFTRNSEADAPPELKQQSGTFLGKSPVIEDRGLVIQESGAITEYLCEKYDSSNRMLPLDPALRAKVREWMWASEATFMIHGVAVVAARRQMPLAGKKDPRIMEEMERRLSVNVQKDLDWMESELWAGTGRFLVGDHVTAADTMMAFTIELILARKLGTGGKEWPAVTSWLHNIENEEGYEKAVQKTRYDLKDMNQEF